MAKDDLHFRLRIPDDLKRRIEASAAENRRSITAEIVQRLESSYTEKAGGEDDTITITTLGGERLHIPLRAAVQILWDNVEILMKLRAQLDPEADGAPHPKRMSGERHIRGMTKRN